jgi:tripartite-type tricarboxylate transporter receptor subunit TctC
VPTFAEQGYPAVEIIEHIAMLAPAGTPRPILDRLHADTVKVMSAPDVQSKMRALGGEPDIRSPEQTLEFLRAEYAKWSKVIKAAGLKAE